MNILKERDQNVIKEKYLDFSRLMIFGMKVIKKAGT